MLDVDPPSDRPGAAATPHDFCATDTEEKLAAWLRVLDLQVELFAPVEWAVLENLPSWAAAGSVLDVGCGNGSYLTTLSRRAPNRRYVGLEPSPDFAAAARARAPHMEIIEADVFTYAPRDRFDLVVMRFVVQHLEDWGTVLDRARGLLTRRGALLIVEPDITAFANAPALPLFTAMLTAYGAAAQSRGRLRASLDDLAARAAERGWLHTAEARRTVVQDGTRPPPVSSTSIGGGWSCAAAAATYRPIMRRSSGSLWRGNAARRPAA